MTPRPASASGSDRFTARPIALSRMLKWVAGVALGAVLGAAIGFAALGWNWLRGPIEHLVLEKTGRALVIRGDLSVKPGWPSPRVRAGAVTFANPPWARQAQMLSAEAVEVTIDLPQLLARRIVLPEVHLERPVVYLEQGTDGRKNWLLDLEQQDDSARARINRLTLDRGVLGYDDASNKTSIRSDLSSSGTQPDGSPEAGVAFAAEGRFKGIPLRARGSGGPVLAMRDESAPYPLTVDVTVGRTRARAEGTITSLLKLSAVDLRLVLSGDSLERLFPLLGIAFPETRAYATEGHLLRAGNRWHYEKFSGRIGDSDVAGDFRVDVGGERPAIKAELISRLLDIADLGPLIGAKRGGARAAAPAQSRVLPDVPFRPDRWGSVDADVILSAGTLRRAKELPLEDLVAHLRLRDSVLTLDPLSFGVAGGRLDAMISLNGREDPIQARARVRARKLLIAKLFPTIELNRTSVGQVDGEFDLTGRGSSVGRMFASSNGKAGLVVTGGEISRLLVERISLHLWEMLELRLTGDGSVPVRCGAADVEVKDGVMRAKTVVFDTALTTIVATGSVDLGHETLDLTLDQNTKHISPVALSSPIRIRGSFARPEVALDKARMAARALGAIALGTLNPALTLIPLIDAGPGHDSDCGRLVRDATPTPAAKQPKKQALGVVRQPRALSRRPASGRRRVAGTVRWSPFAAGPSIRWRTEAATATTAPRDP